MLVRVAGTSIAMTGERTGYGLGPGPVIAGCIVFALVLFLPAVLNDGDTLWQIRTGEWILDHRAVPSTDPFSFTAGGRRWFAHEWLAETIMALAFRTGGMVGIVVLAAGATGLTAALLLRFLLRFLPGLYAVLFLVLALANAASSLLARPHLLAWPCLVLWCGGLVTARATRTLPSLWLLPVMVLWVNLHGSFMFGLLLPIGFLLEAALEAGEQRRRVILGWSGFIAAAWVAALINPEFWAGVMFPVTMLGMQSLAWIGEWQPTTFGSPQPLELMILAGLALGLSGTLRLPPVRLLLLLVLVHAALAHARNQQLLGIVGMLIIAESVGRMLPGQAATASRSWPRLAIASAAIAAVALAARIIFPLDPERSGEAFAMLINRVPVALRDQPVLNGYSLGGQLIFNGVRPFVDSRADLYGDAFLDGYRKIASGDQAALDRALTDYAVQWTIFHAHDPVVGILDHMPGWRRLLEADDIIIQVRAAEPAPGTKSQ